MMMLLMLHHSCDVQQSPLCPSIIHFVTAIHDAHERTWIHTQPKTNQLFEMLQISEKDGTQQQQVQKQEHQRRGKK